MEDELFDKTTKNVRLTEILRKSLIEGEFAAGDRFPSQNELCAKYGVGSHTVREAMASLVHEGLLIRVQGKGTFVAECKVEHRTIGVVMPHLHALGRMQVASWLLYYIEQYSKESGCHIILCLDNDDPAAERDNLNGLADRAVDGIICYPVSGLSNVDVMEKMQDRGIPFVLIDCYPYPDHPNLSYVTTDNYQGAFQAVKRLSELGFNEVYMINHESTSGPGNLRQKGYDAAIKELGLGGETRMLDISETATFEEIVKSAGEETLQVLHERSGKISIFTMNSIIMYGVMDAVKQSGVDVSGISLCTFDAPDDSWPDNITSVSVLQPLEEIARTAVDVVIEGISGNKEFRHTMLEPTVVVNEAVCLA